MKVTMQANGIVNVTNQSSKERLDKIRLILTYSTYDSIVNYNQSNGSADSTIAIDKPSIDFKEFFNNFDLIISYLKSGSTGHTFKAISRTDPTVRFAIKASAYPVKDNYGKFRDEKRPEDVEIILIALFSEFVTKDKTPHLVLPLYSFNTSINNFIQTPDNDFNISDDKNDRRLKNYRRFLKNHKDGYLRNDVSVLVSELCDGDFLEYLVRLNGMTRRPNWESMTSMDWKIYSFHILYTLAKIQLKYKEFKHNDLKLNNILFSYNTNYHQQQINSNGKIIYPRHEYKCGDKFVFTVPDSEIILKIWDFDFASIGSYVVNNKVESKWAKSIGVNSNENMYYDIHFLFNNLLTIINTNFKRSIIPSDVIEFIEHVVPVEMRCLEQSKTKKLEELYELQKTMDHYSSKDKLNPDKIQELRRMKDRIAELKVFESSLSKRDKDILTRVNIHSRLITNDVWTTPLKLLETHPFFNDFRYDKGDYLAMMAKRNK